MKPISFTLALGGGILLGGVGGLALRKGEMAMPAAETVVAVNAATMTKSKRLTAPTPNPKVDEELQRISSSYGISTEHFADWSVADLKLLAKAMLASADPFEGLPQVQQKVFAQIIVAAAEKDREGTMNWIDADFPKQRLLLYSEIMREMMKDTPAQEQIDFLKSRDFEKDDIGTFAGMLLTQKQNKPLDTDTLLYLIESINYKMNPAPNGDCNFAPGVDFARVAEAALNGAKEHGNIPPESFPSNFLEEWTKVAPEAAADYYFKNCAKGAAVHLPYNYLEDLLSGMKATLPEADYLSWFGQTILQQFQKEGADHDTIDDLLGEGLAEPEVLHLALSSIQDATMQERFLREVMLAGVEAASFSDGLPKLRTALNFYQDPAARMAAAEWLTLEMKSRHGWLDPDEIEILCTQLTKLGHSEAEIQRVKENAKEDPREHDIRCGNAESSNAPQQE